ncbi:hypothetical protein M433DRAFT_68009 [Acidomyces richmondensis BFW]|nr:MAG: hypothetical protein FE78DRAFT_149619 [Acidomyces sp. 'richmondensis']KYG45106.1 hypothetical protein M433DRAFT_68009 [Acidomyces richmondensis BFW]
MPDKDALTPRVFLIRHGETEWSQLGRHTGTTEIPLTAHGEAQVLNTARIIYGPGKLIDPRRVLKVWVSPRRRAQRTYELLKGESEGTYEVIEALAEWNYGEYEGLKPCEIRKLRKTRGLDNDRPWDIWRDGCMGGESPDEVTARIDNLIQQVKALQAPHMKDVEPKDIVLVAHGHSTRAFAKRWLGFDLSTQFDLMMEPGGVGVLSYQHGNIDEPALVLGVALPLTHN